MQWNYVNEYYVVKFSCFNKDIMSLQSQVFITFNSKLYG